ncbi:MAG: ABC transporter permease [Methylicorpusculum sp.]|uniref:ABC transporter permease n=1 Tax=Methylicorpusculum sp. TaxID=2713644 RepID=UPI00272379C9|nr:ABC transporter permease [Methylicorpusculum sp.]MDO8846506.1 ABC transporter permease [Methylicorpusculum sp.]MDO8939944.1 ABC transporter permease [Methylicorpusculum sp.]MDP2180519.1 ABC transporter permease [Methylicorpusculum sp.]MDP2201330.1 ABC transporter permease [Methylicorpusculum sp.]MDP3529229.1 ABC transporter permease [Methylicorpusculum sp.]
MSFFTESLIEAFKLIIHFDPSIYQIVWTSLKISLIATATAGIIAILSGIYIGISEFWFKRTLQHILNTLMAMPTVMIGLVLYGLLSRKGPLGELGLLYTQPAVIIGEACLIFPIIMNLTIGAVHSSDKRLKMTLQFMGASKYQQLAPLISELRETLVAALIYGFGRAIGEVGAAMMLGGNIQGVTRTMTTAIALETSRGEFELALALGIFLLSIAFLVNFFLQLLTEKN